MPRLNINEIDTIMSTYESSITEAERSAMVDRLACADADEAERDQVASCGEDGCTWSRCTERAWSDAYAVAYDYYEDMDDSDLVRRHDELSTALDTEVAA